MRKLLTRAQEAPRAGRLAPLLSSASDEWRTPDCVLDRVRTLGPILLDPCAGPTSDVGALRAFRGPGDVDGLDTDWTAPGIGLAFVNPPYGRCIGRWLIRCMAYARCGGEVVALVPGRVDTAWWHDHVATAQAVCLWRGRLIFRGAPAPAPFPSAIVYWGRRVVAFMSAFEDAGRIVRP